MDSKTQESVEKRRKVLAISRAKDRAQIHDQNRHFDEELPQLEVAQTHQEHLDQRFVDLKERRAQKIQEYSEGQQTVEFCFKRKTFKPPRNLEYKDLRPFG